MSDTMEQAANLTSQYEQLLMPLPEEQEKVKKFSDAVDLAQDKFDRGEINLDQFRVEVDKARQDIQLSTMRVLTTLNQEGRVQDVPPHMDTIDEEGPGDEATGDVPVEDRGIYDAGNPLDKP